MNRRTPQWLLGTALVLALFILLFERNTAPTDHRQTEAARLLPGLNPAQVQRLEVRVGPHRAAVLERGTNSWFFRAPWLYPARAELVERCLETLAAATVRSRVSAGEILRQTNGLAAFGLAPPALVLSLEGGGVRRVLHVSTPAALGGQLYVQEVGRDGLAVVDAALAAAVPATWDAWRDTTLVRLGALPFDRLEVQPLTNGFEVLRDPAQRVWRLNKPLPTRAHAALLEHLLQELELVRAQRFLADPPLTNLAEFGLAPPRRELVFARGTNELLRLQVGQPAADQPELWPVWVSTWSNVVLVPAAPLRPWLEGYTNFCDRRLLIFDADQVRRIEIRAEETFALQREAEETWRVVEPYSAPADRLLVLEMLAELAALEFLGFERDVTADFAPYGLDPPLRQYRLLGVATNTTGGLTNVVLAQADFGKPTGHRFYARRVPENSVVLALEPVRVPRAAFQLRDRRLWNLGTNELAAITIRAGGRERKLARLGPMQWAAAEGAGPPLNPVTLEEAAFRLGQLYAERWAAQGAEVLPQYGIVQGAHEVLLEPRGPAPDPPYRIRFGRRAASGRTYAAVTLAGPPGTVIFECPAPIYDFVRSDLSLPEPAPAPAAAP